VTGSVLAVSPDGTTLVITDPIRQFCVSVQHDHFDRHGARVALVATGTTAGDPDAVLAALGDACRVFPPDKPDGVHHAWATTTLRRA